jgi:small-conductance mechanosensitive channel
MTNSDGRLFETAQERISKSMFAISAGGIIALWAWGGWTWGAGFAVGAAASWLNYRWLSQVVDAIGSRRPTRKRMAFLAGLRYLLLGGGAYAILHYSPVSVGAALTGLFAAVAAVIVEMLFQLVYARS